MDMNMELSKFIIKTARNFNPHSAEVVDLHR